MDVYGLPFESRDMLHRHLESIATVDGSTKRAYVQRDVDRVLLTFEYDEPKGWWFGCESRFHSDDVWHKIQYHIKGHKQVEYWFKGNRCHRDGDLPAIIKYYKDGGVMMELYVKNGELCRRDDKPVYISYHLGGRCEWWGYSKCPLVSDIEVYHRDGGLPAIVEYDLDGKIVEEVWFVDGKKVRTRKNDLPPQS